MALDHVRDFWGMTAFQPEDMSQTTPALFFTRWITHFCAPVFVFLAGTSAFLYGRKVSRARLSKFLWVRGVWLIFIEIVVINTSWTFSLHPTVGFVFVQVIWAIGWSMIVLAGLVRMKKGMILIFGLVVVGGHNLLDSIQPEYWGQWAWLWKVLHVGFSWVPFNAENSFGLLVAYPLIPWIGVMALGYVFGNVLLLDRQDRTKALAWIGFSLVTLFLVLRTSNFYGDSSLWQVQERGPLYTFLSFFNTTKYPPSLQFLTMTLGPAILSLIVLDNWSGRAAGFFRVFGRVPFFFYVVHFPLLNATSQLYHYFRYGEFLNFFLTRPNNWPEGYEYNLWLVYAVWILLVIGLYFLCSWYNQYKTSHGRVYWWLKYI